MSSHFTVVDGQELLEISWGPRRCYVKLRRTQRRVLRIEVHPSGNVVVFAPFGEELKHIYDRVKQKRSWLFREIDRVSIRPSMTPKRHFISGETHLLLGKQYKLSVEQSDTPQIRVEGTRLNVLARNVDDQAQCRCILEDFYAFTAQTMFNERLDVVAPPFIRKGLRKPSVIALRMSKRWGSYSPKGRIVLNVDLIRASPMLIDYVICHELTHAFHPDHGKEWRSLLNMVMPDWESRKTRLEALLR